MLKSAKIKNSLKAVAKDNTSISKKADGEETVVKAGIPKEESTKLNASVNKNSQVNSIGMSKGVTKNMGDYESLRVDVWLTYQLAPEEDLKSAYTFIEGIIDETLEEAVLSVTS